MNIKGQNHNSNKSIKYILFGSKMFTIKSKKAHVLHLAKSNKFKWRLFDNGLFIIAFPNCIWPMAYGYVHGIHSTFSEKFCPLHFFPRKLPCRLLSN